MFIYSYLRPRPSSDLTVPLDLRSTFLGSENLSLFFCYRFVRIVSRITIFFTSLPITFVYSSLLFSTLPSLFLKFFFLLTPLVFFFYVFLHACPPSTIHCPLDILLKVKRKKRFCTLIFSSLLYFLSLLLCLPPPLPATLTHTRHSDPFYPLIL